MSISTLKNEKQIQDYSFIFTYVDAPYRKFIQKNKERNSDFKDWFEMHDKIIPIIKNGLEEWYKIKDKFLLNVKTDKYDVIDLPFIHILNFIKDFKIYEGSPITFFNQLIFNESKEPKIIFIYGHKYLIPSKSSFLLSDINNISILSSYKKKSFDLFIMDPPWENKSVQRAKNYNPFHEMNLYKIPFLDLTKSNSLIFIWVTNKVKYINFIKQELFNKWKITYITTWYWLKVTTKGEPIISLDSHQRKPYEQIIIGYYGNKIEIDHNHMIISCPSYHSQKPNLLDLIKTKFNYSSPIELFARELHENCCSFGNEVLKFQDIQYYKKYHC